MSIVLKDLTKRYGKILVVNAVSAEVQQGELFVLLGASGSGKSTILRMIAGLTRIDGGSIQLNGKDVTNLAPQKRGTGFVFQNYSLFRHMTVSENVEFGLRVRKFGDQKARQRRDELLDLVGLGGLGKRYPSQLSGGQQQRVALARALAYEPAVLLLDEPFGALDVKIRTQLRKTLKQIQRKLQLSTILVTHDQEEAFELADRIGLMERGNLLEIGSPEKLYHSPETEFAATFVGGKNVLVARTTADGIRFGNKTLPVPPGTRKQTGRARIVIRPENVVLSTNGFSSDKAVHILGKGTVVESIFSGSFERIRIDVEAPDGIRASSGEFGSPTVQIEAVRPSGSRGAVEPGKNVWVGFKNYHVLETQWPRLLICVDENPQNRSVVELGCSIAEKAQSTATLLMASSPAAAAKERERLEAIRQEWLPKVPLLDVKIRSGSAAEEISIEAQEGHYDLILLGRKPSHVRAIRGIGTNLDRLLNQLNVPVLVVPETARPFSRILICSAVGEPGKVDILVGGRLARITGAAATVLHVGNGSDSVQQARIKLHLEHALRTLRSFEVAGDTKLARPPAAEAILNEARSGNYDMIVIGASAPRELPFTFWQDVAAEIVTESEVPVLIVPMMSNF